MQCLREFFALEIFHRLSSSVQGPVQVITSQRKKACFSSVQFNQVRVQFNSNSVQTAGFVMMAIKGVSISIDLSDLEWPDDQTDA
jgi:hypothetical protein